MLIVDDKIMRRSTSALMRFDKVRMICGKIIVAMFQGARILRRPQAQCEQCPDGGDSGEHGECFDLADPGANLTC